MKNYAIKILLIIGFLQSVVSCSHQILSPTSEIADPHLKEITMIRADPHWGAVVIYNPITCKEIGAACGFLKLHVFAHKHLNHTLLADPAAYPVSVIKRADCWAAKYGKTNEIEAVISLFEDGNQKPNWRLHGDLQQRAENIRSCALKAGKIQPN